MNFGNLRVILEYFLKANPMVRSLYTSADMEVDLSVTLEPMDRFKHMRGPFGVVFQG